MKLIILTTVLAAVLAGSMAANLDGLGGGIARNIIGLIRDDRQAPLGAVYRTAFETENGIQVEEEGSPGSVGQSVIRGSYSYTAPNGEVITVTYIADENGFQPSGAHLPTPPPMPLHALRQIEFAAQQARNRV